MAATIRDIKKMTGLSLATVSKYLNGGNVLQENRAAIEHAIEILHYEVNEVARGLATNRTKTIGVIIGRLDNVFESSIISHMEDILRLHDYGTIICDSRGDEKLEAEAVKFLLSKRVDGIITIPISESAGYLESVMERGLPVVLIDRELKNGACDRVLVDNEKASEEAVKVLLEHGHKRIAIVCGEDKYFTARGRLAGYFRALEDGDLPIYPKYIKKGNHLEVQHGYESMNELLDLDERPTAVFLSNYETTLGAIIALNERGVHFPDELSIIGFDNMMLAQVVKPRLWMVMQPIEEIAQNAAEMMLQRLGKKAEGEVMVKTLHTTLVQGDSVKKM